MLKKTPQPFAEFKYHAAGARVARTPTLKTNLIREKSPMRRPFACHLHLVVIFGHYLFTGRTREQSNLAQVALAITSR